METNCGRLVKQLLKFDSYSANTPLKFGQRWITSYKNYGHNHHFSRTIKTSLTHWHLRGVAILKASFSNVFYRNVALGTHCDIALKWMPRNLTSEKSTLVQIMAWYHATSHYLDQCWPRPMSPYVTIRSQTGNIWDPTDGLPHIWKTWKTPCNTFCTFWQIDVDIGPQSGCHLSQLDKHSHGLGHQ